jgi:hypothetical protein
MPPIDDITTTNPSNMSEVSTQGGNTNIERLRNYSKTAIQVIKSRDWKGTLRGPQVFFGIASTTSSDQTSAEVVGWTVPKANELGSRASKNAIFFATNYAVFSAALMIYEIITDWTIMLWLFGVVGAWTAVLRAAAAGQLFPLSVGGITVGKKSLYVGMSVATSIILTIYVGSTFLFVTGCTAIFSAVHSVFRNPLSYKTHDSLEETQGLNMESGGFEMSSTGVGL